MSQQNYGNITLILFPSAQWNLYGMELRRLRDVGGVFSQGDFVDTADDDKELGRLAGLCLKTEPGSIYERIGKNAFRTQKKFFENADAKVRRHVEHITGKHILEAVEMAARMGIRIFFKPKPHEFIEPSKELEYQTETVALHTFYRKTDDGLDYRLTVGNGICPSEHKTIIISNEPSLFSIDNRLMHFDTGLNGNLLRPFTGREWVHIPARMQSEYMRKMILKIAGKIDIDAEGFNVTELHPQGSCRLSLERNIAGGYHFHLSFDYDGKNFDSDSQREKSVTLHDDGADVSFVCISRNRQWEDDIRRRLDEELLLPHSTTLQDMLAWANKNRRQLEAMGIEVEQLTSHKYYIGNVMITNDERRIGDWFQIHIMLNFDNGLKLPLGKLRTALLNGEKEYLLPDGKWFVIPDEWFARYNPLMLFGRRDGKDGINVHRSQTKVLDKLDMDKDLKAETRIADHTLPKGLRATLRPYQMEGYEWLLGNIEAHTGCCLSDDMGLGKTIQSIALILKYKETASPKSDGKTAETMTQPKELSLFTEEEMGGTAATAAHPVLVVAPASVVYNWRNEILRFAPSLKVMTYTGSTEQRQQMRVAIGRVDVVVTTYATMRNDIEYLCHMEWGINIFDESQIFKNDSSQTYEAVKRLGCQCRVALSGTPMENNLRELWTLMNVLNPELLGERSEFSRNFEHPINEDLKSSNTDILRQLVAPYFLRRTKDEVLDSLPERQDEIVYCDMTPQQASLYEEELSRMRNQLLQHNGKTDNMNALKAITRLRQIACSPALVGEDVPSGKMEEVFGRLDELYGTSHKVLVFSEYVSLLDIVAREMDARGWTYARLSGSTRNREEVIAHFQQDESCQFFLISLKAGGLGLNLTQADYVFLLDPWWNVTAEEQAISRAHRQGQQRSVFVYRFISTATLEEQILRLQDRKQSLIDAVLGFLNPTARNLKNS